jgi:hypothetical protein
VSWWVFVLFLEFAIQSHQSMDDAQPRQPEESSSPAPGGGLRPNSPLRRTYAQSTGELAHGSNADDTVEDNNEQVRQRLQEFAEDRANLSTRLRRSMDGVVPSFQRVSLVGPPSEFDEDAAETGLVCRGLLQAIALRRRYHQPCKAAPYHGPFDPAAYARAQDRAEAEHRQFWGPSFRGRAAAIYEASMPGSDSGIVHKVRDADMTQYAVRVVGGVMRVVLKASGEFLLAQALAPTAEEFVRDLGIVERITHDAGGWPGAVHAVRACVRGGLTGHARGGGRQPPNLCATSASSFWTRGSTCTAF